MTDWEEICLLLDNGSINQAASEAAQRFSEQTSGLHEPFNEAATEVILRLKAYHLRSAGKYPAGTTMCISCGDSFNASEHQVEGCCSTYCALSVGWLEECPDCANTAMVPYGNGPEPAGYEWCSQGCMETSPWVKKAQLRPPPGVPVVPFDDSDIPF